MIKLVTDNFILNGEILYLFSKFHLFPSPQGPAALGRREEGGTRGKMSPTPPSRTNPTNKLSPPWETNFRIDAEEEKDTATTREEQGLNTKFNI